MDKTLSKAQLLEMKARAEQERDLAKENFLRALGGLATLEFQIRMLEEMEAQPEEAVEAEG